MAGTLHHSTVKSAYARWAPVYDTVFDWLLAPGRRAIVEAVDRPGLRVLDVGVGTGLELPLFGKVSGVTGIDLSEPMLRRAQARVLREGLNRVEGLAVMDASRLAFADGCFDAVIVPYVLTTVPDPSATLREVTRVVRAGGDLIFVHHVAAEKGPRAMLEHATARLGAHIGWRPEFPWSVLGDFIAAHPDLSLIERRTLPPLNLFTFARIRKSGPPKAIGQAPPAPRGNTGTVP